MREHAFDGEMGLAGVGRSEHGGDAAPAMAICGIRGEGPAHLLTSSSSDPRETRNTGGTNLVRIADSAHSDFVPKGIRGSGSLFQSTRPAHSGVALTTKSGLSLSLLSQAPRKTKGTKGGRIRGALIFGICSLQHIGIMGLCVNPRGFPVAEKANGYGSALARGEPATWIEVTRAVPYPTGVGNTIRYGTYMMVPRTGMSQTSISFVCDMSWIPGLSGW